MRSRSLNELQLLHELVFVVLVLLASAVGAIGLSFSDKSLQESQRINALVQEVQQTRGDLYRQLKELFDGYFLADKGASAEYNAYTTSIRKHFIKLKSLAVGHEEQNAIADLSNSYEAFVSETINVFNLQNSYTHDEIEKKLNSKLEKTIFNRYEIISARAETILATKQQELTARLQESKHHTILLISIPIGLALLMILFSRIFLQRAIVKPISSLVYATNQISTGNLQHKAPVDGATEIANLAGAINYMAEELTRSQDALVQSEKQAAQGLLVPMLAHNIRNPLASIRATAQVTDNEDVDEDTRTSLKDIIYTVDKLERWTGALLAYLHPLKPNVSKTTLRQIVEGAVTLLHPKLKEKSLSIETPEWGLSDDGLMTDQHMLEQALYNLILNAIEASPIGAHIEIFCEISTHEIALFIADRGTGLSFTPDPLAQGPGPTTKQFGTGLGIPFAFKVMEALGGKASFHPREGGGTRISLKLPKTYKQKAK